MADEILLIDEQQQGASQARSRAKGVQGKAKPTRGTEKKDVQSPPAAKSKPASKWVESFVFGISQFGVEMKERQVPMDEPPALTANSELTYIGKPTER